MPPDIRVDRFPAILLSEKEHQREPGSKHQNKNVIDRDMDSSKFLFRAQVGGSSCVRISGTKYPSQNPGVWTASSISEEGRPAVRAQYRVNFDAVAFWA